MNRPYANLLGNKHAVGNKPNKTSFKPGEAPWNKGVQGIHLSPNTEFKKGRISSKILPVGTITIRYTKKSESRQFIKTSTNPDKWEEYAKWLWKKVYGSLFPGDVVHHINGDKTADSIDNLIALPRADHVRFHNRWGIKPIPESDLQQYKRRYTIDGGRR